MNNHILNNLALFHMSHRSAEVCFLLQKILQKLGKDSVSGSSSLDGSRPCFSTQWQAASTRFPLLPLVPSFAAMLEKKNRKKLPRNTESNKNYRVDIYSFFNDNIKNKQTNIKKNYMFYCIIRFISTLNFISWSFSL